MTTFDTNPSTQTVAAGWSSSPLGNPDHNFLLDDAVEPATAAITETEPAKRVGRHVKVAAALVFGIAGGAAVGLAIADFAADEATVVRPASPQPQVVQTPHVQVLPPAPVPTVAPTAVAPAPTADVATPPSAPAQSTVVDVPTPQAPAPEAPAEDDAPAPEPEDPAPEPPVLDDLPIDLPEPPEPQPPVFDPDLPLTPAPAPNPDPVPLPDFDLNAGP